MLKESKGNMYTWVTHTWNPIKGACYHDCTYCYMKRWGKLNPVRLDEKEFKIDLGSGNFIFVGSGCDVFALDIWDEWIRRILEYCGYFNNKYLFQSKNTARMFNWRSFMPDESVVCTTIETNRFYKEIMNNATMPEFRAHYMRFIPLPRYCTIEPIMDFDLNELVVMIKSFNPIQVNIGADSGYNHLPEPSKEKILALIDELKKFTVIDQKRNLDRLLK